MNGIKFACCARSADFEAVAEYGYDFIEIAGRELYEMPDGEYAALRKQIEGSHVKCCGCNAYCPPDVKMAGPGFSREKAGEYARRVALRATALGAGNVGNVAGNVGNAAGYVGIGSPMSRMLPRGYSRSQALEEMKMFLEATAEAAKERGMGVLVEALNPGECNFITSNEEALAIAEDMAGSGIGIVYDIYHAVMSSEEPGVFRKILPHVRHIHVCGIRGTDRRFPVKDDMERLRPYLEVIKTSGYKGIISVETGYGDIGPAREALYLLKGEFKED